MLECLWKNQFVLVSLGTLCLMLPGCRPATSPDTISTTAAEVDQKTDRDSSSARGVTVESVGSHARQKTVSQKSETPSILTTPTEGEGLMSLDPRQDGWNTEHLNFVAGGQLKKLGHLFEKKDAVTVADLKSLLSQQVVSTALQPTDARVDYRTDHFEVTRSRTPRPDRTISGIEDFSKAFSALAAVFPRDQRYTKFKIIRVSPLKAGGFRTEQLVSFNGRDQKSAIEQNSTWEIEWSLQQEESPRIESIAVKQFEQSRAKDGPLFRDLTASVMRHESDIAEQQFGVGIDQWVRRLDHYQLVFQFGHNGIAVGDVNGDGREDIYRCQVGGLPNRLLIAQTDGSVRDHSSEYGVDFLDNSRSALLVDLDNDGDQDLVVAFPFQMLFLENTGGKFEKRHKVEVLHAFSLSAADYDLDGDLDVYACVYYANRDTRSELPVPMPIYNATNGGANLLLRNDGEWNYVDVTKSLGLDENNSRFSYAAVWEDYDNDGQLDLFVANDFGRNNLYHNVDGKFTDVTEATGAVDDTFGMSAATSDINRDGWIDFYKANMFSSAGNRVVTQPEFLPGAKPDLKDKMLHLARGNTLLVNREGRFTDECVQRGAVMGRWSWGSIFLDFNNDGWEDIFVSNGFVTGPDPDDL